MISLTKKPQTFDILLEVKSRIDSAKKSISRTWNHATPAKNILVPDATRA